MKVNLKTNKVLALAYITVLILMAGLTILVSMLFENLKDCDIYCYIMEGIKVVGSVFLSSFIISSIWTLIYKSKNYEFYIRNFLKTGLILSAIICVMYLVLVLEVIVTK